MTAQHDGRKRRFLKLAVGVLVGALLSLTIVAITVISMAPTPISPAAALQVKKGMTESDVRSLLGEPHDLHVGEAWVYRSDRFGIKGPFFVEFDEDRRVRNISWL